MLIGFLGLPNSGKTTIASKLFSHLKENASTAELIVEQARFFIAEKKVSLNKTNSHREKISLTDEDQLEIAKRQKKVEQTMTLGSDPRAYIIADSSVQNSAIYISDEYFNNEVYLNKIAEDSSRYDLLFYCHPFELEKFLEDTNRVHTPEQIDSLRQRADKLLEVLKKSKANVKEIMGTFSLENRFKTSLMILTEEHHRFCSKLIDE